MRIRFKKLHEDAVAPRQSREGDAAWDLVAVTKTTEKKFIEYGTGIAVAIPEDHVGLLFPRSSVSNYDVSLANCVGVIDHNYRGEIKLRFKGIVRILDYDWVHKSVAFFTDTFVGKNLRRQADFSTYEPGDKVGQLIIIPRPFLEFEEAEELDETNRGADGFGSSGK